MYRYRQNTTLSEVCQYIKIEKQLKSLEYYLICYSLIWWKTYNSYMYTVYVTLHAVSNAVGCFGQEDTWISRSVAITTHKDWFNLNLFRLLYLATSLLVQWFRQEAAWYLDSISILSLNNYLWHAAKVRNVWKIDWDFPTTSKLKYGIIGLQGVAKETGKGYKNDYDRYSSTC